MAEPQKPHELMNGLPNILGYAELSRYSNCYIQNGKK